MRIPVTGLKFPGNAPLEIKSLEIFYWSFTSTNQPLLITAIFGQKSFNFFAGCNYRKKSGSKISQVWGQYLRSYKVTKSCIPFFFFGYIIFVGYVFLYYFLPNYSTFLSFVASIEID